MRHIKRGSVLEAEVPYVYDNFVLIYTKTLILLLKSTLY